MTTAYRARLAPILQEIGECPEKQVLYAEDMTYIRQNPVEGHLAIAEEKYPYSSACAGFERDPRPQGLKPESLGRVLRHG